MFLGYFLYLYSASPPQSLEGMDCTVFLTRGDAGEVALWFPRVFFCSQSLPLRYKDRWRRNPLTFLRLGSMLFFCAREGLYNDLRNHIDDSASVSCFISCCVDLEKHSNHPAA